MSDPQPVRRSGVPLLEVGVIGLALIGIALFIWRGLEKSRETAMRGVAKAELTELGFTITEEGDQFRISAVDIAADQSVLNDICVFKEATHLSLRNSWIDGEGLKQLSELKELQSLDLPGSKITDADVGLLTDFPNLKRVSLRRSLIEGHGLKVLADLPNLESINLSDNELTDECRRHLTATSVNTQLALANTWLSEAALAEVKQTGRKVIIDQSASEERLFDATQKQRHRNIAISLAIRDEELPPDYQLLIVAQQTAGGNCEAVRYVDHPFRDPVFRRLRVSGIRLLTSELDLIEKWRELRFLDLTSLHIAGVTFYQNRRKYELPGLAGMSELEKLSLAGTGVGDYAIRPLSQCRNLNYLDLRMTDLNGEGLTALSDLRKLEVLRLSHNMIEDDSLAALSGLTSLKRLELDSTDVTDEGLKHLRSLENLKELSISHTRVTDEAARALQKKLGLRNLSIVREYDPPPQVQTGPALRPLVGIGNGAGGRAVNKRREAPYTEELIRRGFTLTGREDDGRTGTLASTQPVIDDDMRFASRLTGLKSIAISVADLTPVGMWYLKRLPELESLTLTGPDVRSELLTRISELKELREMTIRECDIDAAGLEQIASSPTLKTVRLELAPKTELSAASIDQAGSGGISFEIVSPQPKTVPGTTE
jgi:Leucine-rich repeat (LRR) protein